MSSDTIQPELAAGQVPSPVMTPSQAAAYLNLAALGVERPERTVMRYASRGMLEYVRVAGRVAFMRDQLDRFLMECRRHRGVQTPPARAPRRNRAQASPQTRTGANGATV